MMLILKRKPGKAIVLNSVITVQVLAIEGSVVKLGITAPPDVQIVRDELLDEDRQAQFVANKAKEK